MEPTNHVTVHALSAGYLTLPEALFVTPLFVATARKKVPSLSFLIQHVAESTNATTRIVFDLGIRRRLSDYPIPIYTHAMTRQPLSGEPDVVSSLAAGGLEPEDIDIVMFSHLHWDHVGTPSDFPTSTFVVGPDSVKLLDAGFTKYSGSHNHFEHGLLDVARLIELPPVGGLEAPPELGQQPQGVPEQTQRLAQLFSQAWRRKGVFDATIDIFGDGSLYVISAPGHLDGHINLLCRKADGSYVYLAGDSCHDERLLKGTKDIATWTDPKFPGSVCCIHGDKEMAEDTLQMIRSAMGGATELGKVEVIFAHDQAWEADAIKRKRFLPGVI